ncbi:MAG: DUF2141 domain-containing protein [Acidobacteria bacterium]|nr:DUF2141 domain-containing protein [Acidobacteriota bacterium]
MSEAQRTIYVQTVKVLATDISNGDAQAVKAMTISSVAADFGGIASTIQSASPLMKNASVTIDSLYALNATDLKTAQQADFFCSGSTSRLLVTLTIPNLPPGRYVVAIVHATGVAQPQQMAIVLQNDPPASAGWKLAGLFVRPMSSAGHDGLWYWTEARKYADRKLNWNAFFYYQTAEYLLRPVDFLSSPNLEKLQKEATSIQPEGIPGVQPMQLTTAGKTFYINNIHTDGSLGGLDLVINYQTGSVANPVAVRAEIIELMKGILDQHPELRLAFHGLWVYANAPGQQRFAIELPMNQIAL